MPNVLTTDSTVLCGPTIDPPPPVPIHGGNVNVQSSAKLKVNRNAVLLRSSIEGRLVSGCATPSEPSSGNVPCATVSLVSSGEATKLTVQGNAVILDILTGSTNGTVGGTTPQTLLGATAGQNKLTAI